MIKIISRTLSAVAAVACITSAQAGVITFDDLDPGTSATALPEGYGGFSWSRNGSAPIVAYSREHLESNSGFTTGVTSGSNAIFNAYGVGPAIFDWLGQDSTFDFISANFTSGWNDQDIMFAGWRDNQQVYMSQRFSIGTDVPLNIRLDWRNIDRLVIYSENQNDYQWVMDDFSYNVRVPEPATALLFGATLLGMSRLRRKNS
ncbi:PEP-CTERM sorting domain-containing protein [Zooshikella marina]|uniref:PEP-CTERM sorting domain-containing protein n=1 Tax=Zooshikella ganghwensis TaxID=202772 RepID=A0A4P9VII3_9GAMM|nr:PEP-CTERM sorting domain-containing protein [Zooshikella ganghwensis]MBU2706378.1 PEP-CTERM sorting domain-containing protein [Zooshikella ganghwensis]RDH42174.1 PEP-CTERM sorting domain-containing protein [Zooshikella ganghwensis]